MVLLYQVPKVCDQDMDDPPTASVENVAVKFESGVGFADNMCDQDMDDPPTASVCDKENVAFKFESGVGFADNSLFRPIDDAHEKIEDETCRIKEDIQVISTVVQSLITITELEEGEILSPKHEETYEKNAGIGFKPEAQSRELISLEDDVLHPLHKNSFENESDAIPLKSPSQSNTITELEEGEILSPKHEETYEKNAGNNFKPEGLSHELISFEQDVSHPRQNDLMQVSHTPEVVILEKEVSNIHNKTSENYVAVHLKSKERVPEMIEIGEDSPLQLEELYALITDAKNQLKVAERKRKNKVKVDEKNLKKKITRSPSIDSLEFLQESFSSSSSSTYYKSTTPPERYSTRNMCSSKKSKCQNRSCLDSSYESDLSLNKRKYESFRSNSRSPYTHSSKRNKYENYPSCSHNPYRYELQSPKKSKYCHCEKFTLTKSNVSQHSRSRSSRSHSPFERSCQSSNSRSCCQDKYNSPSPKRRENCHHSNSLYKKPNRSQYSSSNNGQIETHSYSNKTKYRRQPSCPHNSSYSRRRSRNKCGRSFSHIQKRSSWERSVSSRNSYSPSPNRSPRRLPPIRDLRALLSNHKPELPQKKFREHRDNLRRLSHFEENSICCNSVNEKAPFFKNKLYSDSYEKNRRQGTPRHNPCSSIRSPRKYRLSCETRVRDDSPEINEETPSPINTEYIEDLRLKINRRQAQDASDIEMVFQEDVAVKKEVKTIKKEETEGFDKKGFKIYYCAACQISLNSDVTWQTHIMGKKHAKVLKQQAVHEVTRGTLAVASTSAFVSEEMPRFGFPPTGTIHVASSEMARLQPTIDECKAYPLIGLEYVKEIQAPMEVKYYCALCDAPCSMHSIMPHLIGIKHQLHCVKKLYPALYERNKMLPKKIKSILMMHESRFGRYIVRVVKERADPRNNSNANTYGLTWRSPSIKTEKFDGKKPEIPAGDACLDTSKADFLCKLCDAHMNNTEMWEAHIKGKRHLNNMKNPSEIKPKTAQAPFVSSELEKIIDDEASDDIIVGLEFIRETQGANGTMYTCFLCGACCTNYDILDHLELTKHKSKFLEKMDADGKKNSFNMIRHLDIQDDSFRKSLIEEQCVLMLRTYGRGRVEVYVS